MLGTILLIILILLVIGAFPRWPYMVRYAPYGYGPTGALTVVLLIVVVLLLLGYL